MTVPIRIVMGCCKGCRSADCQKLAASLGGCSVQATEHVPFTEAPSAVTDGSEPMSRTARVHRSLSPTAGDRSSIAEGVSPAARIAWASWIRVARSP